jgi:transcriptional regulator with XRE-family HTH domain
MKGANKMPVTDKIKALLSINGKKNIELAQYLGITPQSLQNKFARGSFSAEDLIRIADFLGCTLEYNIDDKQKIILDMNDITK